MMLNILNDSFFTLDTYCWRKMKTRDGYIIKLPVGDFTKEEITVKPSGDTVCVKTFSRKGRNEYRKLCWEFLFPEDANIQTLRAKLKDGKLRLMVDRDMSPDKKITIE